MSLTKFMFKEIGTIITLSILVYANLVHNVLRFIYYTIIFIFGEVLELLRAIKTSLIKCKKELLYQLHKPRYEIEGDIYFSIYNLTISILFLMFIQCIIFILVYLFLCWYYKDVTVNESFIPSVICLANIKQNRLSLKSLEQKLAKLEKSSNTDSRR